MLTFCAPTGVFAFYVHPTAYAVGAIIAPLHGYRIL